MDCQQKTVTLPPKKAQKYIDVINRLCRSPMTKIGKTGFAKLERILGYINWASNFSPHKLNYLSARLNQFLIHCDYRPHSIAAEKFAKKPNLFLVKNFKELWIT